MAELPGVVYQGTLSDSHVGYTQAGLNYLMAMRAAGLNVTLRTLARGFTWKKMPFWALPLQETTGRSSACRGITFNHHLPNAFPFMAPAEIGSFRVGCTTHEVAPLQPHLIEAANANLDLLLVPSRFNADQFRAGGLSIPVEVVPHCIGPWWWEDVRDAAPRPPVLRDKYVFYYVGAWSDRKNPEGALRAYLRAFPEAKSGTAFVIKTGPKYNLPPHRDFSRWDVVVGSVRDRVAQIVREETGGFRQDVHLFTDRFTERQIRWLHSIGDCFVSAHRGEGFGLGPFQAKLLGKRVIYTDFSAVPEFMTADDIPVSYSLTEVTGMEGQPHFLYFEDCPLWAEPEMRLGEGGLIDAFHKAAFNDRKPGWYLEAMRDTYSWEGVGGVLRGTLERHYTAPSSRVDTRRGGLLASVEWGSAEAHFNEWATRLVFEGIEGLGPLWVRHGTADADIARTVAMQDEYSIRTHFPPGTEISRVVDVGAHIGAFSLFCLVNFPAVAEVLAWEPSPANCAIMAQNLRLRHASSRVTVHQSALCGGALGDSVAPQWAALQLPQETLPNGLHNTGSNRVRPGDGEAADEIAVLSVGAAPWFDNLEATGAWTVDILKLDCEGSEWGILRDLGDRLARVRFLAGELHVEAVRREEPAFDAAQFEDFLREHFDTVKVEALAGGEAEGLYLFRAYHGGDHES